MQLQWHRRGHLRNIHSGNETMLIDCGYEGLLPKFEQALSEVDLSFIDITGILITYHDIDHMGGLFETKANTV
ncbi:MAG: MBL fold metallo-hydrolase [Imperialibacter sp.]